MRISEQTLNRLAVLKAIRRSGPVSRSDLVQATGLSGGTITNLTADLLERGLILERPMAVERPGRGRPRVNLEIAAKAAVVVGASITGQSTLTAAFVDLAGALLFSTEVAYDPPTTIKESAEHIAGALAQALDRAPFDKSMVKRVGIAIPAILDSERGIVHYVTSMPPGPVPVAEIVSRRLGLPVTIEHEVACMARAEHWFGRAQQLDTFTMVHVGYALGSAEYSHGVPKAGANGLNSELGHVKTDFGPASRGCLCGSSGCVMMYCSMFGMLQAAGKLDEVPFPPLGSIESRFEDLIGSAAAADAVALRVIEDAALHLGRALANMLNSTDPREILIAVWNAEFLGFFEGLVSEVLRELTLPVVLSATKIRYIVADRNWRRTGTAALALEQTYLIDG